MERPHFMNIGKEDYLHIARALVLYDSVVRRNGDHKSDMSPLQERWLVESERYGATITDEERDQMIDETLKELDAFAEAETWQELAWWLAEREYRRLAKGNEDTEARDLTIDRIYHQLMEEFAEYGVEHIELPGIGHDALPPQRVADALKHLRVQTRHIHSPRPSV